MWEQVVSREATSARPVTANGLTVTQQARVLVVRLPFARFVWNRPVAVIVEWNGRTERIPVVDVTRRLQLMLLGLAAAFLLIASIQASRRKEQLG